MVAFKTSFIVTTLVLITLIVHYSLADETDEETDTDTDSKLPTKVDGNATRIIIDLTSDTDEDDVNDKSDVINQITEVDKCKMLLKETNFFKMGDNDGLGNFKYSFKNLSVKKLNKLFALNEFETDAYKKINILKHTLTLEYFLELFENHGIDIKKIPSPEAWCTDRASKVYSLLTPSIKASEDTNIKQLTSICEIFINRALFSGVKPRSRNEIFETMYYHWSRDTLMYDENPALTNQLPYFTQLISPYKLEVNFFVDQFIVTYFTYFQTKVMRQQPGMSTLTGTFKSVRQFCEDKGKELVKNLV